MNEDLSQFKINRAIGLLMAGQISPESSELMTGILRDYVEEDLSKGKDPFLSMLGIVQELYNLNMMSLTMLRMATDEEEEVWLKRIADIWIERGGAM